MFFPVPFALDTDVNEGDLVVLPQGAPSLVEATASQARRVLVLRGAVQ